MKLLHLDIETRPGLVYVWSPYKPHIDVDQIVEPTSVLCFAALWHGEDPETQMQFKRAKRVDSHEFQIMIRDIHKLLSEADAVCHFNGDSFDLKMLNQEFARMRLPPVPPLPSIDLKTALYDNFRLFSGRLKFAGPYFGIGKKQEHEGWPLWRKCMDARHPDHNGAWERMEAYNKGDVALLPDLYELLRPWLKKYPNMGLYADGDVPPGTKLCPRCGSARVKKAGLRKAQRYVYQRYYCRDCQGWSQSAKREKITYTPELK